MRFSQRVLAAMLLALMSVSCSLQPAQEGATARAPINDQLDPGPPGRMAETQVPAQATQVSPTSALAITLTVEKTAPALPQPTRAHTQASVPIGPCQAEACILDFPFPFSRPIAPPGRDYIDISYRFSTTVEGKRDPHHGVEFLNSQGTPVLAAADGEVVVAGDDLKTKLGLYPGMYGNLVVLQHDIVEFDAPVFTLYAHLSKVDVQVGDVIQVGQKLGEVGATGAAIGSHLHFEVRYAENVYSAARNPELWLQPLSDSTGQPMGALAGRILDGQGNPLKVENIVIETLSAAGIGRDAYYISTYPETKLLGMEPWQETFAIGDLPAGEYKISFVQGGMQQRIVEVMPGELTLVTFQLGE